jgi:Uncharacterized protein conserved in bacteria
LAPMPPLPT